MSLVPWLSRPLNAFFEAVGMLVGEEFPLEINDWTPGQALEVAPQDLLWVETRLQDADDFAILLLGADLVRYLGAQLLMLPTPPAEVTEEVQSAFDEIVNVAIGAWNREVADQYRWDNGVDARSIRAVSRSLERERVTSGAFRGMGFSLTVAGKPHQLLLLGTGEWLPEEATVSANAGPPPARAAARSRIAAAVAPPAPPRGGGKAAPPPPPGDDYVPALAPAAPRPSSGGGRPAPPPFPGLPPAGHPHADIALVDVSGVFLQWFYDQLKNPSFSFSNAPADYLDSGQYRAVLLINPQALHDAGLSFDRQIIMRRS